VRPARLLVALALAATAGDGYWLLASDGGIFPFGDAPGNGSGVGRTGAPATAIAPSAAGSYRILTWDGATLDL